MRRQYLASFPALPMGVLGVVLAVAGCEPAAAPGRVAVIDLDRAAAELGRLEAVESTLRDAAAARLGVIERTRADLRGQLDDARRRAGDEVTADEQAELLRMTASADQQLDRAIREANAQTQQERTEAVARFREEVLPVAQRVAAERGCTIVMVRQPMLLSVDPAADVTDATIAVLRAATDAPAGPTP